MNRKVLGLDGGGSKTICIAADDGGHLLSLGRGGCVNTNYVPRAEAASSLRTAIQGALNSVQLAGEDIDRLCMSAPIAPDSVDLVCREVGIKKVVRAAEGSTPRCAARYFVEGHVGVTIDAGTGAMARGWAQDGREAGASGWGATLGDEGSGYWIGIEAMRAVLHAFDGRTKPTMLTEPVLAHLGLADVREMIFKVDQALVREESGENQIRVAPDSGAEQSDAVGGVLFCHESDGQCVLRRHEIARLCPVVADVASWGDWKAKEIFRRAGEELGRAGVAVIKRLRMEQEEFVVVPFGGVFKSGELVLGAFRNKIQEAAPRAQIVEAKFEPAVGAVLMALDSIGVELNSTIVGNVRSSFEELSFKNR